MTIYFKTARGWRPIASVTVNQNDRQGIFNPATYAEVVAETTRRARDFERDVALYFERKLPERQIHRAFSVPMYGAFGEKL